MPRTRCSLSSPTAFGVTCCHLGALPAARQHLEEAIALYTPDQRHTPVFRMGLIQESCQVGAALTLWFLGWRDQALAHIHEALALVQELSHHAAPGACAVCGRQRLSISPGRAAVNEQAEAAVALATRHGFPFLAAWE